MNAPIQRHGVVVSWSGGKDSTLMLEALQDDPSIEVVALLTTVSSAYDRVSIHGVRRSILHRQAESLGLPLHEVTLGATATNAQYERAFGDGLRPTCRPRATRAASTGSFTPAWWTAHCSPPACGGPRRAGAPGRTVRVLRPPGNVWPRRPSIGLLSQETPHCPLAPPADLEASLNLARNTPVLPGSPMARLRRAFLPMAIAAALTAVLVVTSSPPAQASGPARPWALVRADSARDPMARLNAELQSGRRRLAWDSARGYLPALLEALDIPRSSQLFVFSRTSLQTDRIAPWTPRAIYFNDDVYVGFVQESPILEIGAVNPATGGVFYTITQDTAYRGAATREGMTCLMCHQSRSATGGVPGFMVLSTVADRMGYPMTGVHDGSTTDMTPHALRYGGWYVTGQVGANGHAANRYASKLNHEVADRPAFRATFAAAAPEERQNFAQMFDTTAYLGGQSDVVALMVLTHQTLVHNRITAVHEAAREAAMSAVSTGGSADTITPRLRGAVENLSRAMLFLGEAPLTATVQGSTTFAADFAKRGPFDPQGRTLRTFDLQRRLFRYPMSFLVYSDAFDAIPANARKEVYARLWTLLLGRDPLPDVQIASADRSAIVEILSATKPEFAAARPK